MQVRQFWPARLGLIVFTMFWVLLAASPGAVAAPYAAMVIDARTGEVLHSRNADARLHPASLTKMMTLYIAFEAVRNGEIGLDTQVRITREAAAQPPSKLGLRAGQKIAFRYLIRAAAVKSANDAATAIGVALSGSEAAFARRMTRTARAMGMSKTTFKNANGLTAAGHLSTARDMTKLGRHLLYDYPEYYNLFSRQSTSAGVKSVNNTNRRLLKAYRGADGIKTGYTRAAGFNLVASAKRGNKRVIATVFGGTSSSARNARVAELLDLGFRRAPSRAPIRRPDRPLYAGNDGLGTGGSKTIRVAGPPSQSLRPRLRPDSAPVLVAVADSAKQNGARIQAGIDEAIAAVDVASVVAADVARAERPQVGAAATAPATAARPAMRPKDLVLASTPPEPEVAQEPQVVTRLSTSGGRFWGVNVGRFPSRYEAEKVLLRTALTEMSTLDGTLRKVNQSSRGYEATFQGMTQEQADLACRRLNARNVTCFTMGPG